MYTPTCTYMYERLTYKGVTSLHVHVVRSITRQLYNLRTSLSTSLGPQADQLNTRNKRRQQKLKAAGPSLFFLLFIFLRGEGWDPRLPE